MAAIGNSPTQQAFTPAIDYFSGNGSTTAFTLSRPVASVAQVQVTIDNVAQNPSSAFTVSANTITFTSAPLSGTNNIYVYYTSPITQVIAPGQGTVTSESFGTITNFTTTGNTVLGDATTDTLTVGVTGIVKDSSGNVGIGGTPVKTLSILPTSIRRMDFYVRDPGVDDSLVIRSQHATNNNIRDMILEGSTVKVFTGADSGGSGSERMRIDSSGNVLVGATTPYSGTVSNVTATTGVDIGSSSTATSKQLQFIRNGSTGTAGNIYATAGSFSNYCGIEFVIDNVGGGSQAGYLKFNTTNNATSAERMRIDSSGNLLVGTTSGSTHIIQKSNASSTVLSIINSSATSPSGAVFNFSAAAPNNGTQTFWAASDNAAYRGGLLSNGGLQNYQANNSNLSDQREKKEIQLAPNYLDKICQIPVKTFLFNDQTDTDLNLGAIAQDVQAVCPELVMESNWGSKEEPKMRLSIYQTDLQYALMKSIQELKALNDTQAETINALTARIVALENR
jgi:hypothetical protein